MRWRRRIPVSVRHHWRLLATSVALVVVLVGVMGSYRVRPLVLADTDSDSGPAVEDISGTVGIFDADAGHEITLRFDQPAYDRMVSSFLTDGSKPWVEADLTIDGTSIPSVGLRLKGNSTLMALRRNAGGGGGGPGGLGGAPPDGGGPGGVPGGVPGGGPGGGPGGFGGGPGFGSALSVSEPEGLPWLISFDEFVDGRRYQGREEIAVRPAGRSGTTLNEAVALSLVGQAGEPTQRWAYSSFVVNDRPATTRLLVEVPDDEWADQLGRGVLYKALSTGQFAFKGEDPTAYEGDFAQINRKGSQDLQPVIDLMAWVERATDDEFAAGLGARVDVASFARYLALQNLLLNFDDMAGPGKNYYLYYDLDLGLFRVLTWDMNFAFSGEAAQGPYDAGGFGRGGAFRGGNRLKERFLETPVLKQEYERAYRRLYQQLYADGAAARTLATVSASMAAATAGTETSSAAESLRALIESRTASLARHPVIVG